MTTWPLCYNDNTTKASAPLIKASQRLQIQFNSLRRWRRWYHYAGHRHRGNHCRLWEEDEKSQAKKEEWKKMEWWWWGGPNLQLRLSILMCPPPTPNSNSYSFNASTAVYLPWLPVIILNMSFSSIHPFKGCWVWLHYYGDTQNQWCGGHLNNVGRALQWCVSRC